MKNISILLLLFFFVLNLEAKTYKYHVEIGKKSAATLKAEKVSPELDEIATSIIAGSVRVEEKNLSVLKLANKDISHTEFNSDDASFLQLSVEAYRSKIVEHIKNPEILADFDKLTKSVRDYSKLHFELRRLCEDASCTADEREEKTTGIIGDWKAETLMADLVKLKNEMSAFNLRVKNALRNSK